jgi:hypothetical protein
LAAVDKEPGQPRLAFVQVDDVPWTEVVDPVFTSPPGVADGLGSGDRWS